jgi:hypothetical protein
MLPIVKATFPGTDFENVDILQGCEKPNSDIASLSCKWKVANQAMAQYSSSGSNIEASLNGLYEV